MRGILTTALAVVSCAMLLTTVSGCRTYDRTDEYGTEEYGSGDYTAGSGATYDASYSDAISAPRATRLEETWGPGEYAALLTGTVGSKDRNFLLNVPLASWYVREQDRKGMGILGGAIAYDMVTVERENGAPVSEKLTSHGLLGLAGNITKRSLDGSGDYVQSHWVFPFYRYYNKNGERTIYPLMLFPWTLRPKTPPVVASYNPTPWNSSSHIRPIDPAPVQARTAVGDTSVVASPPRTVRPASEWAYDLTRVEPRERVIPRQPNVSTTATTVRTSDATRTTNNSAVGTLRPSKTVAVKPQPVKARPRKAPAPQQQYRVRKGDTLYAISRRFYGSGNEWQRIYEANRGAINNEKKLPVGLALVIPQ